MAVYENAHYWFRTAHVTFVDVISCFFESLNLKRLVSKGGASADVLRSEIYLFVKSSHKILTVFVGFKKPTEFLRFVEMQNIAQVSKITSLKICSAAVF
jgi:hypothetical protein